MYCWSGSLDDVDDDRSIMRHWEDAKVFKSRAGTSAPGTRELRKTPNLLCTLRRAIMLVRDAMLEEAGDERLEEGGIIVIFNNESHVSAGSMPHVDAMLDQTQLTCHLLRQAPTIALSSPLPPNDFLQAALVKLDELENDEAILALPREHIYQMMMARGLSIVTPSL